MPRRFILGALIATAVVASGCSASHHENKAGADSSGSAATVLSLANSGDALDLGPYIEAVRKQSAGSIDLDVRRTWRTNEIDSEARTIEDVRKGRVDMASIGARAFDRAGVAGFEPLVAPLQVDSYALEAQVLASPAADRMLATVTRLNLVGIALLPGEMRRPLGVSRALVDVSDYRGAAVGVRPSDISARSIEALGGKPQEYGLRTDVTSFDGIEGGLLGIDAQDYDAPARTLTTNVNLWPRAVVIVINRKAYDSLSDEQRDALVSAGAAAVDPTLKWVEGNEDVAMANICTRDRLEMRTATPAQLDGLRAAVQPLIDELEHNPATRASQGEIEALRDNAEPEEAPACPRTASVPATTKRTALNGVWVMDSNAGDLAETMGADINAPDVVPENWGHQTFVLDRGRFAFTEANDQACTWGFGHFSVSGDRLNLTVENGGGRTPNNARNRPGEEYEYKWSLYRDQLTLDPVRGAISPPNFRANPWRRTDADPSLDALSHACLPPAHALDR